MLRRRTIVFSLLLILSAGAAGAQSPRPDERGNVVQKPTAEPVDLSRKFHAGLEFAATAHNEEGLDKSKGEYSVSYGTLGGSLVVRYDLADFFLQGGVGLMRLTSLTVNSVKIDMQKREQWHVPVSAHLHYKVFPVFNLGLGLTHLTETTMYVNSQPAPDSRYNHVFADGLLQVTPQLAENLTMMVTVLLGVNLIPGRQHTYSVGDLLHIRVQANVGLIYAVF